MVAVNVIAICGKAGSGKDTIANILVERAAFVRAAFADPLKRIAADLWGFSEKQLWGPSETRNESNPGWPKDHVWSKVYFDFTEDMFAAQCERCARKALFSSFDTLPELASPCVGLSAREALQLLGTEVARQIHPDTWTRYLLRVASTLTTSGAAYGVVVPDARFVNEVEAVKSAGGLVWLVERPGAGLHGAHGEHTSETSLDDWGKFDAVIQNDGTFEDLEKKVREITP